MLPTISYLKNLMQDKYVSSVTPTAPWCVAHMLSAVPFEDLKLVVEYGPALGAFTRHILARLGPRARLVAIERNENFAQTLRSYIPDQRLDVVCDSAENVVEILSRRSLGKAGLVVSGIPFSFFGPELTRQVLGATQSVLEEYGDLVIYQSTIQWKKAERPLDAYLGEYFSLQSTGVEWLSIPPLKTYQAKASRVVPRAVNY